MLAMPEAFFVPADCRLVTSEAELLCAPAVYRPGLNSVIPDGMLVGSAIRML